jgi:hypothetical protein
MLRALLPMLHLLCQPPVICTTFALFNPYRLPLKKARSLWFPVKTK